MTNEICTQIDISIEICMSVDMANVILLTYLMSVEIFASLHT